MLTDKQHRTLALVRQMGTGVQINQSTARLLERHGLIERYEGTFTGQYTQRITPLGALVVAHNAGEDTKDLVAKAMEAGVTLTTIQRACWHETGSL